MSIFENLSILSAIANDSETIANLILIFAAIRYMYSWRWITFNFVESVLDASKQPTGEKRTYTLKMRAMDVNEMQFPQPFIKAAFCLMTCASKLLKQQIPLIKWGKKILSSDIG